MVLLISLLFLNIYFEKFPNQRNAGGVPRRVVAYLGNSPVVAVGRGSFAVEGSKVGVEVHETGVLF